MSILSFDNIKIETPYKLISILDINFEHGINMHSTLILEAICEEDSFESFYKTTLNDFIKLTVNEQVVFNGLIGSYNVSKEGNVYSIIITGVSATCLLDSKIKSKSFQDKDMNYSSLIKEIIKEIKDSSVSFNIEDKEIKEPIICYNETIWEFLKRMASHFNNVLICDTKEHKPRFYFGFNRIGQVEIPDTSFYTAKKDLRSLNLSTEKLLDTDFFCHEITTKDVYQLQNEVRFKNKKLYISNIKGEFIKGELIFTYKLSRINGIRQNKIYNENIKGASLEGKVLDTKEELVKLHLNIDEKQDKEKAHWFKVGHLANNVFYLMFEKNTDARLYFPSNKEVEAEVKNSVRRNGDKCPLTKEPKNRYLTTKDKNQMSLKPRSIEFKSNENLNLSILMEDEDGAKFISNKDINLNSKANISFNAKRSVNIKAKDFVLIQKYDELNPQSITIENEFHFLGSKISLNGRDRSLFRIFNDDPVFIEIKRNKKELKTNPRILNMNNEMSNQKTKVDAKSEFNKSAIFKTVLLGCALLAALPIIAVVAPTIVTVGFAFGASLLASSS